MQYPLKFLFLIVSGMFTAGMQSGFAAEDNVGLGLYQKPEFPGSKDNEIVVLPSFDATVGNIGLSLKGVDLSLDVIPSPALNAGLTIRYDEGRDDTVSNDRIRLLPAVDASPEFGVFVESGLPVRLLGLDDSALLIGSVNFRTSFDAGHGGKLLEVKVGVLREFTPRLTLIAQLVMVQSDATYNRSYFGVDSESAVLTGLDEYTPGNALKETGATVIINRHMGGHWYAGAMATVTRLSSELADSPVVRTLGSRTQWLSGAFLTYYF